MVFTKLLLENALVIRPCNCEDVSEPLLPKVAWCIPVLSSRYMGKCAARVLKRSGWTHFYLHEDSYDQKGNCKRIACKKVLSLNTRIFHCDKRKLLATSLRQNRSKRVFRRRSSSHNNSLRCLEYTWIRYSNMFLDNNGNHNCQPETSWYAFSSVV